MRLAVRKFFIYFDATYFIVINVIFKMDHIKLIAGSLESAYSLNWGALQFLGKGGGETLALL